MADSDPLSNHYAIYDPVSGAMSRRAFLEEAVSEFRKFQRYKHPFALLIIDIDYTPRETHPADQDLNNIALKQFVTIFMQLLREQDLIGRLGEDEFGVLLLETDGEHAQKTAERLRQSFELINLMDLNQEEIDPNQTTAFSYKLNMPANIEENKETSPDFSNLFSASIGISTPLEVDRSFEQVFTRADQALNAAIQKGGNCVVLWNAGE